MIIKTSDIGKTGDIIPLEYSTALRLIDKGLVRMYNNEEKEYKTATQTKEFKQKIETK